MMPQSGVLATPQKGLEKECHSRTSGRHHRKGFKRNATVGRRGDITEKGFDSQVNNTHNKHLIHENKWVSPSTGIFI